MGTIPKQASGERIERKARGIELGIADNDRGDHFYDDRDDGNRLRLIPAIFPKIIKR